ncbi:MAG: DUF4856 domain-containing protein [Cyclobacteriaceae bacterium]
MNNRFFKLTALLLGSCLFLASCGDDDNDTPSITTPVSYSFERNGASTVDFSGQMTRILMAEELISGMMDFDNATEQVLLELYRNEGVVGEDVSPFANANLNASTKSIKSKIAASRDFFATNNVAASKIKADFETWISAQIDEMFPAVETVAEPGIAGQIADGSAVRYVSGKGLEYDQLVTKSMIGALMLDQTLNHYLSTSVLDEADNIAKNDADVVVDGTNYTTMEHKWDEAYGYVYGTAPDPANPNATIGADDSFLNKYIGRVEGDPDFTGIADDIFNAFALGRAAIVAKNYTIRDQQAEIIREKLSEIMAIRAIFYLQQAKIALPNDRSNTALYGTSFHDLSEGYGFIYSLQFTRQPGTSTPYFSKSEVDAMLVDLLDDGPNGLWNIEPATLDQLTNTIHAKFDFSLAAAAE